MTANFLSNTNSKYYKGNSFWNVESGFDMYKNTHSSCNGIGNNDDPFITRNIGGVNVTKEVQPMSQDQLIKLLFGMIFIRKYVVGGERDMRVPLNTSQWSYSTADDLNQRAKDWIDRTLWRLIISCFSIRHEIGSHDQVCSGGNAAMFQSPFKDIYSMWGEGDFFNSPFNCFNHYYSGLAWYGANQGYKGLVTSPLPNISLNNIIPLFWGSDLINFLSTIVVSNINNFDHEMFVYLSCMNNNSSTIFQPGDLTNLVGLRVNSIASPSNLDYQINALMGDAKNLLYGSPANPDNHLQSFMNQSNFECLHETRNYEYPGRDGDRRYERNGLFYMLAYNIYSLQRVDKYNFLDMADNSLAKMPDLLRRTIRGTFPKTKDLEMINANGVKNTLPYTYGTTNNPANIMASNTIKFKNCVFQNGSRATITAPHIDHTASLQNGTLVIERGAVVGIRDNRRMECNGNTTIVGGNGYTPTTSTVLAMARPPENTHTINQTKIQEISNENVQDLRVYPNPTQGISSLRFSGYKDKKVDIYLYDMMGRILFQSTQVDILDDELNYNLPTEDLHAGYYLVKTVVDDEEKTLKLQKQ